MPATIVQTSLNGGEISPRMYGRVDVERFNSSVKEMTNCHPVVQGGALGRAGTVFVCEARDVVATSRLVPFIYDRATAYVLEFSPGFMRVIRQGAQVEASPGVPYEVASPYTTEESVRHLDFAQGADTMFLTHQWVFPQRLQRFGDASWQLAPVPFTTKPHDEVGFTPAATLTLSAGTVGPGRTATTSVPVWLASDVGRTFKSVSGLATITGFTSSTVVTVTVDQPFINTAITIGAWRLLDSPQTTCTPSALDPVGATITLTLAAAGWRSADVGAMVRINGGLVQITSLTSDLIANGTIERVLNATVAAEKGSWTVEPPMWDATQGYPGTVTLYEQRLLYAGSPEFPQDIWGSVTAAYLDFTRTLDDGDSFNFRIASDQLNPITYLASVRTLLALTYGGEFTLQGGLEKPLTPTNVQIRSRSNHGCAQVRPARIRNDELYVQRAGRKVRALAYNVANDDYTSPDMTALADHMTETGIVSMAWQQEPEGILWLVRADGVLLSFTFDRDNNVIGWARHITQGSVTDVTTVPGSEGDDVYLVVRRDLPGGPKQYIERMQFGVYPDCAVVAEATGPDQTVWGGLDHLEGLEVYILADGSVMPRQVVTGGQVTLDRPAFETQIGLPYQRVIDCLDPEMQGRQGSAQGNSQRTNKVALRLLETLGIKVNGNEVVFRQFGAQLLDRAPQPFSGIKELENLGWEKGRSPLRITQDDPNAFHVLSVIRNFEANA